MTGFETQRLMDLAGFAAHHDFQTHITKRFRILWYVIKMLIRMDIYKDVLYVRNVYMERKENRKTPFFNFEDSASFATRRHI